MPDMQWHEWIEREVDGLDWVFRLAGGGQVTMEHWTDRPNSSPSIAWTLWHVARTHDFIVNAVLRGEPQVWEAGWVERLGLDTRQIGTGMDETGLAHFDAAVRAAELQAYWHAVLEQTKRWLPTADLAALRTKPPAAERFAAAGEWHAAGAEWLGDFWGRQESEFLLRFPAIAHGYVHFGESQVVATLLGSPGR